MKVILYYNLPLLPFFPSLFLLSSVVEKESLLTRSFVTYTLEENLNSEFTIGRE